MITTLLLFALSDGPTGPGCLYNEDGSVERVVRGYPEICSQIPLYLRPATYVVCAMGVMVVIAIAILYKKRRK